MKIQIGDEVRDATPEEEAFIRETQISAQAVQQASDEQVALRASAMAKLESLGLTEQEVRSILGI